LAEYPRPPGRLWGVTLMEPTAADKAVVVGRKVK
jgi:hypothetical protein